MNDISQKSPQSNALIRSESPSSAMQLAAGDASALAMAAQSEADVRARWAIAQRCPRSMDDARVRLLSECKRPTFARTARYAKPVGGGKKVEGPSIRFVEAALRCMTNVKTDARVVSDTQSTRRIEVAVTDLETNTTWSRQVSIEKTVERRSAEERIVLYERLNSEGKKVYVVLATEDELAIKEAALVSKTLRTLGLRVLPGDLVDDAMEECRAVVASEDKKDPNAAKKRVLDAFAAMGVMPSSLEEYLGHSTEYIHPKELQELRELHQSLQDGDVTWVEALAEKATPKAAAPAAPAPAAVETKPERKMLIKDAPAEGAK